METLILNDSGRLPVIGLGTWAMGGDRRPDHSRDDEMTALIQDAIEMGYTHIDTAEMYGAGHCEDLVGRALQNFAREDIFVTTKVLPDNLRHDDLLRALDGSLQRLQTDYADLYLIHWPDPDVPLEESFRALNRAAADGRIRRVGVSNFELPLLRRAQALCATPIVTDQVRYNLHTRAPEQSGLLRYCQENNIVLTAYSPLKDGVMGNETVQSVARKHGATAAQVALRWLTRQPQVVTIPMSSDRAHLRQNLEALTLTLDEEDVQRLDQASK
jgi:diketogulonate reductase-like aldo/keto reductase